MRSLACEPCAKRKVRCDRKEPCSNCKRRRKDICTYPELLPSDRIKKLEALVRSLGGDPETEPQNRRSSTATNASATLTTETLRQDGQDKTTSSEGGSRDAVVLEEDGQQYYLESGAWHGWLGGASNADTYQDVGLRNPFLARNHPNAFQRILSSKDSVDFATMYPPRYDADVLWDVFYHRVDPVVRISFSWELKDLQSMSLENDSQKQLTDPQHALIFSVYLISVVSLSEEECLARFHKQKSAMLYNFQTLCEEALSHTNLFCIMDITVMKALTIYMMAGMERLSTQSLWSLMGLIIRNAEKLGIHRDGTLLGLSPFVTEERRRLWWQLQHLDLVMAIRAGLTPLTLKADWDAKIPLNIEDDDINVNMTEFPTEREGMTSMSYCRYTYWVIDQQRAFFRSKESQFELSWQSNKSLPYSSKETLISQLQEGLNKNFLQYCDPIRPIDTLIQISARALICGIRERSLQPLVYSGKQDESNEINRQALLDAAMQSIRYNIALHSSSNIRHFQWLTKAFFSWSSFMCVLVEISQQKDVSKTQQMWDLLSELYSTNPNISELTEDRRRFHAAELVVAAWKSRQHKAGLNQFIPKLEFVTRLEHQLSGCQTDVIPTTSAKTGQEGNLGQGIEPFTPQSLPTEQDMDLAFDLDFQDIDWSFWNSMD